MSKTFTVSMLLEMVNKVSGPAATVIGALNRIDAATLKAANSLAKVGDSLERKGKQLQQAARGYGLVMVGAVGGILKYSSTYEDANAKFATITKRSAAENEKIWGETFRRIARETGLALEKLPLQAYEAISGGISEENVEAFLLGSRELAKASFMTMEQAVDMGTSVRNVYRENAHELGNWIMAAQDVGKITGDVIAPEFSKVADLSKELGIGLGEMFSAWAAGSMSGMKPEQITTQMKALFSAMMGKGAEQTAIFDEIGVSLNSSLIAQHGFQGALAITDRAMRSKFKTQDQYLQKLRLLLGSQEAVNSYLRLISEDGMSAYDKAMKLGAGSTDLVARATQNMGQRASEETAKARESFKGLIVTLGKHMMPAFSDAMKGLSDFITRIMDVVKANEWLQDAIKITAALIAGIITITFMAGFAMAFAGKAAKVFAFGLKAVRIALIAVRAVMIAMAPLINLLFSPMGILLVGIPLILYGLAKMVKHWDHVKAAIQAAGSAVWDYFLAPIGRAFMWIVEQLVNLAKWFWKAGRDLGLEIAKGIRDGVGDAVDWVGDALGLTSGPGMDFGKFVPGGMDPVTAAPRPTDMTLSVDMSGTTINAADGRDAMRQMWGQLQKNFREEFAEMRRQDARKDM